MSSLGINPQPITKKGIQEHNPQIHCIYTGKKGVMPTYRAIKPKEGGTALGTIYEVVRAALAPPKPTPPSQWIGKIGRPTGRLRDDPNTIRTRAKKDINLDAIREKLGYDLYQELGRGIFHVPKTRLSLQHIMNDFTIGDSLAWDLCRLGISDSLRIMSRYIKGYQDLHHATVRVQDVDDPMDFITYLHNFQRPPTLILSPAGKEVPLVGIMGLLAVGRVLGDTDIIGGSGGNAGFVWIKNPDGEVIAAQVYKIDPGECFNFKLEEPDRIGRLSFSKNWLVNTRATKAKLEIGGGGRLEDERDLQIAQSDSRVTLEWQFLSPAQKDEFIAALFNSSRYLRADEILKYLFYRDGKFNRSPLEQISEPVAEGFQKELQAWLQLQLEVYHQELQDFKSRYPEQVLRAEYIDRWGELPLPASDQTFPIRELFTQLTLIEAPSESSPSRESPAELPERDSLIETQERMNLSSRHITLETLFDAHKQQPAPRKVLLLGRAGIGKSTLCQKIAHDWASGRLWSDRYNVVYWLPLRALNKAVDEGGFLFQEKDPYQFIAKAAAHILLNDPSLAPSLLAQIQQHGQEILILLDGLDEASPLLMQYLMPILQHPEFILLVTSRPGVTEALHPHMDRLVDNIGFSKEHISQYALNFFSRGEVRPEVAQARTEKFLAALQKKRNLFTVAHIPLILQMLCLLWEQGAERVGFPQSLAELYQAMVDELFRWQCRKEGTDPYAISGQERKEVLGVLGQIAFQGLRQGKLIIPGQSVQGLLGDAKVSEKELLRTGLLRATGEGITREYSFLHLTFQEYMIAWLITQKTPQEQKTFIVEHRCKPQFQLVLTLMAGIIDRQDPSKEKLKQFFDHLHTAPGDLTGFYQLNLTLRCLQQCSDPIIQEWVEDKYHVYEVFLQALNLISKNGATNWTMKDWVISCIDYLNGSEKTLKQVIIFLFFWKGYHLEKIDLKLKTLAEEYPGEKAHELFETLLEESDEDWFLNTLEEVLTTLCKKFSSEQWARTFQERCQNFIASEGKTKFILGRVLCASCPPERWNEAFRTLYQLYVDPDLNIKTDVCWILGHLCQSCPSESWDRTFKMFFLVLKEPDAELREEAADNLQVLCRTCPAEQWSHTYDSLLGALVHESEKKVRSKISDALKTLSKHCPPGKWRQVFWSHFIEASDEVDSDLEDVRQNFCRKTCRTRWEEMSQDLQQDLHHQESSVRVVALLALRNVIEELEREKKFTPEQRLQLYQMLFKFLQEPLQDSDSLVRSLAILNLGGLCEKCPVETYDAIAGIVKPLLLDPDPQVQTSAISTWGTIGQRASPNLWFDFFKALKPALSTPDLRIEAVFAMRRLKKCLPGHWDEYFESVRHLLRDPDAKTRKEAVVNIWLWSEQCPPESWYECVQSFLPLLGDSERKVRKEAAEATKRFSQSCPPEHWHEVFQALLPLLGDSDEYFRIKIMEGISYLNHTLPLEQRIKVLKAFCQFLLKLAQGAQLEEEDPLKDSSQRDNWYQVFEAIYQASGYLTNYFMRSLSKGLPHKPWKEAILILRSAIQNTVFPLREKCEKSLFELCSENLPLMDWNETFGTFCQAVLDPDNDVRWFASWGLQNLCKNIPSEKWVEVVEVASRLLEDESENVVSHASQILHSLSLNSFTKHLQCTPPYLRVYLTRVGAGRSPLYINRLPQGQSRLACIENNQEITREISEEEYSAIQETLIEDHILGPYVEQYMEKRSPKLDLHPFTQWLEQKFPGKWNIQEKEGLILEYLGEENRLLNVALLELLQLADSLELGALQIGRENRRITIRGELQGIKKLLESLKTS